MSDLLDFAGGSNQGWVIRQMNAKVTEPNLATGALENASALQAAEVTLLVMDVA